MIRGEKASRSTLAQVSSPFRARGATGKLKLNNAAFSHPEPLRIDIARPHVLHLDRNDLNQRVAEIIGPFPVISEEGGMRKQFLLEASPNPAMRT